MRPIYTPLGSYRRFLTSTHTHESSDRPVGEPRTLSHPHAHIRPPPRPVEEPRTLPHPESHVSPPSPVVGIANVPTSIHSHMRVLSLLRGGARNASSYPHVDICLLRGGGNERFHIQEHTYAPFPRGRSDDRFSTSTYTHASPGPPWGERRMLSTSSHACVVSLSRGGSRALFTYPYIYSFAPMRISRRSYPSRGPVMPTSPQTTRCLPFPDFLFCFFITPHPSRLPALLRLRFVPPTWGPPSVSINEHFSFVCRSSAKNPHVWPSSVTPGAAFRCLSPSSLPSLIAAVVRLAEPPS